MKKIEITFLIYLDTYVKNIFFVFLIIIRPKFSIMPLLFEIYILIKQFFPFIHYQQLLDRNLNLYQEISHIKR